MLNFQRLSRPSTAPFYLQPIINALNMLSALRLTYILPVVFGIE